ncbi:hypothetical protein HYQ43_16205 [Paracoccus pantotrophus]|uniref:Uncharacterized protein n=1 Tax=Paracoccus pantotrophus TaxID=82367 RepID=A0A7H9BX38_PARPN|nr:hypothetical protein [Paracoccus pantotrophus]QLH15702.1 hypothetical protein HYQ43_16205 [Paracoccus pantotrophus]
MSDLETAKALIEGIQNQSSLLLSLTTALLGGTAALMVQLKVREARILPLKLNACLIIGILVLAVSCLTSWAVVGALINKIPVIMSLSFSGVNFSEIKEVEESTALTLLANVQFFAFIIGTLLTVFGLARLER